MIVAKVFIGAERLLRVQTGTLSTDALKLPGTTPSVGSRGAWENLYIDKV